MPKYVVVSGTSDNNVQGALHFAKNDVVYNLRVAKRKHDKDMYIRMLKLKSHISYGIRNQDSLGHPLISLKLEKWKNGEKYVVRGVNGKFRAVIDK